MKNIIKSLAIACLLSLSMVTSCYAYSVQVSDSYGAGAIYNRYNSYVSTSNYAGLQATNFGYCRKYNGQDMYTSYIDSDNTISYLCNDAGYVNTIQVVSTSYDINCIETTIVLDIVTDFCDPNAVAQVSSTEASVLENNTWYCSYNDRYYWVYSFYDENTGHDVTKISAIR